MTFHRALTLAAIVLMITGLHLFDGDGWAEFLGAGLIGVSLGLIQNSAVEEASVQRKAAEKSLRKQIADTLRVGGWGFRA